MIGGIGPSSRPNGVYPGGSVFAAAAADPANRSLPRDGGFKVPDRVFLFHGVDVKGFRDHGRGAMEDMAGRLRSAGFPEATALHYNSDSWLLNQLAVLRENLFGTFSRRLSKAILEDLKVHPLAPGQKISLVGYSLGSLVASRVAAELARNGVPVGTLGLIEPKNAGAPSAVSKLPQASRVVLFENQTSLQFDNPHQDPFYYELVPGKTHLEMVETPDENMIKSLIAHLL